MPKIASVCYPIRPLFRGDLVLLTELTRPLAVLRFRGRQSDSLPLEGGFRRPEAGVRQVRLPILAPAIILQFEATCFKYLFQNYLDVILKYFARDETIF